MMPSALASRPFMTPTKRIRTRSVLMIWIQPGENLRWEFNHRYGVPEDGYFRIPGEHDRAVDQR